MGNKCPKNRLKAVIRRSPSTVSHPPTALLKKNKQLLFPVVAIYINNEILSYSAYFVNSFIEISSFFAQDRTKSRLERHSPSEPALQDGDVLPLTNIFLSPQ